MTTVNDNLLYIANSALKIVAFNEAAKAAFPLLEIGQPCPEATDVVSSNKENIENFGSTPSMIFLLSICRWVNFTVTTMEYPGHGKCYYFSGALYNNLNREIMSRVTFMNNFTFAISMNLTLDKYVFISEESFGKRFQLSEEPLSKLIKRTCATMVHPDDHKKFLQLMNLETMSKRFRTAKKPITEVIREKGPRGTWDDVTIYLVPEVNQQGMEMAIAFMYVNITPADKLNKSKLEKDKLTGLLTPQSFQKALPAAASLSLTISLVSV